MYDSKWVLKKTPLKTALMHCDTEHKVMEYTYFYKNMLFQVPSVFHLIMLLANGCN